MTRRFYSIPLFLTLFLFPAYAQKNAPPKYLALGDSISFGMDISLLAPNRPLPTPDDFRGYPEIIGDYAPRLKPEVNASCPGETSASFLNTSAFDLGCNQPRVEPDRTLPPFKTTIGLHVPYTTSQIQFAVSYLNSNKKIELVTLGIGGNDLLLAQIQCATRPPAEFASCVQSLLTNVILPAYAQNLTQLLTAIRIQGQYNGKLMLVKYFAPAADPVTILAVTALNNVMTQVGQGFGAVFADGFTAFRLASLFFQGDPCKAGLLARLSPTTCDIHPSRYGQSVLAATVAIANNRR
jgi:lysophospholipase L1-like esterase